MAVTRSGPGVTPPADRRRWVPLLRLASRLSFHPRHWRDWRSSVKSRCEPPNNGAVVEIVAYLKNKWKKGSFPFSISPIYLLGNGISFLFLETNRRRKKRTEEKLFLLLLFFFFFFFLSFSTTHSHRVGQFLRLIMQDAVQKGDAKKVAELIRQDPDFKVNMAVDEYGGTLLHYACFEDSRSAVIPILLAHPDIDVNLKDSTGWTPFYWACWNGRPSCVREMLKDSRVKVNEPAGDGCTPLWVAASNGHLDVIRVWIASGREMNLGTPGDVGKTDAIGGARKNGKTEVVALLERFKSDAAKTRSEVRKELGITGQYHSFFSID